MLARTRPGTSDVHSLNTIHRNKLDLPRFQTATGQRSFVYRANRLWNNLSRTLTDVNNLINFKDVLKSRACEHFIVS